MGSGIKPAIKKILGEVPLSAEMYWHFRQAGIPLNESFSLRQLAAGVDEWRDQAVKADEHSPDGKRVFIFACLHYWISHATLLGLGLAGLGHQVTLAYLPYGKWQKPLNRFDLRRQNLYAKNVLRRTAPLIQSVSFLDQRDDHKPLPAELQSAIEEISLRDTQYTLQIEEVDRRSTLYRLRLERNTTAARTALAWLMQNQPDVVIIPNGSILEFGAVFQAARYLSSKVFQLPIVTYEFGEQRERVWLAQNSEVMKQQTDELWSLRSKGRLTPSQLEQVRKLYTARRGADLWNNFVRQWQGVPSSGGEEARRDLGLNGRPVVLLATNVIGDSLTLGRQVFSDSMTEWLERTILFFAELPSVQLVVRIHPGEMVTKGPSVADVVSRLLPQLPEHIHLVPADAQINTYDIVDIADLGLVYTTTVGLEMAMSGVPVIVIGRTHYRGKGFTIDPRSWDAYFETLGKVLSGPEKFRLTKEQVERAWEYAYRFFFEYPHPFPWHLVHMWNDVENWSVERVLSNEGLARFGQTFQYMAGKPIDWLQIDEGH